MKFIKSPDPSNEESYLNFLIDLAKKEKINDWVVYPNSDNAVYILSKYKKALEEYYRIPTPSWETIQYVYDKKNFYKLAEKHEIPFPKTYYPNNINDLKRLDLNFPVIIKPSITDHFYNRVKIKAIRINNRKELIKKYQWVCSIINPSEVLIQEFIPGGPNQLYSFCPFYKNGKVLISIMARRTRQHPIDFGHASTFAEIVNIPILQEISEKLLRLIGYYGIAEIEFMQDPTNGIYKLIELNPRVWGWHTLAIAAGADLPYLLYQDMIGHQIEISSTKKDMKWVRLTTDIPIVFTEILKRRMTLANYIISLKGKKEFAVFSFDDPLPFFMEILMLPYLWKKRGY